LGPAGPIGPSGPSHEERNADVRVRKNKNFRVFIAKKLGFYKNIYQTKANVKDSKIIVFGTVITFVIYIEFYNIVPKPPRTASLG
jgi:hypothetical protein